MAGARPGRQTVQSDLDVTTTRDDLGPLRVPGAVTLLVAAALCLLVPFLQLLSSRGGGLTSAGDLMNMAGYWGAVTASGFTAVPVLLLPVLAVVLVARPRRLPQARAAGRVAVALYVVALLGGGVALIAALGAREPSVLDGTTAVQFALRQLALLAVAAVALACSRRLSAGEPAAG
jgi:hypothetical protein